MTDYTKLIERLRKYDRSRDFIWTANIDAADAIEALQGEVERLTVERDHAMQDSQHHSDKRLALQAKLDKLQRQEPVLFIHPATFGMNSTHVGAWKPGHELAGYLPLYAAPKVPNGASAATQLHAMAANYPAGHLWDKLDAQACIRGALEIEALRAAPKALEPEQLPEFVLVQRKGFVPKRKGPFFDSKHTVQMLRELYEINPDYICTVIEAPDTTYPESGIEYLQRYEAAHGITKGTR